MKLRFTTKSFIFSNILFILFRTMQIIFLTESGTRFLKPDFFILDVILTVLCLLPVVYTAADAFYAFRLPEHVGKTGLCGLIVGVVTGIMFLISLITVLVSEQVSAVAIVFTLMGIVACVVLAVSEVTRFTAPKPTALLLVAMWMYEFISAYTVYTGRSLRVRTVYEIIAMVLTIFFFLCLAKAYSGVKLDKNFRFVYSLGLTASTFCYAAAVPELIATVFGFSENVTEPCVSWTALLGAGIFMTYMTLATNTFSNTHRKKQHS